MSKAMHNETKIQLAVCNTLKIKYPSVFFEPSASGVKMPIYTAAIFKKMRKNLSNGESKGFPDLFIFEARNGYHGLAIELKDEIKIGKRGRPLKGNGPSDEQLIWIDALKDRGYMAVVSYGYEQTMKVIDKYLRQN